MPFTTLQDRRLIIERQPTPGSQYQKAKFNLGEVHLILPPAGQTSINCQGVDIPPEGKRLQVTKELVALIQAGFVRIAHDISNTQSDQPSVSPLKAEGDSPSPIVMGDDHHVVSSLDLAEGKTTPSVFSSVEEIRTCEDRERVRLYVKSKTGAENEKAPIEGLRSVAEKLFVEGK